MKMSALQIGGLLLACILLAAFVVLLAGVDATELGNAALAQLVNGAGTDSGVDEARFSLRDGLTLRGVTAETTTPSADYRAEVQSLRLEIAWLAALGGEVRIRSLTIEGARLEVELPEVAPATDPEQPAASPVAVHIERAELRDGSLVVAYRGQPEAILDVDGIEVDLTDVAIDPTAVPPLVGISGTGTVRAGPSRVGSLLVDAADGRADLSAGTMIVTELVARAPAGRMRVPSLEIDLSDVAPAFDAEIEADEVDLNVLAGLGGGTLGAASFRSRLSGTAEGELVGEGGLILDAGGLPHSDSLAELDEMLGTSLASFRYEAADIRFRPTPRGIRLEPFELVSDALRLRGYGVLLHGQKLDLNLSLALPRTLANPVGLAGPVLDAVTDADGWITFPIEITGTILDPTWTVDTQTLQTNAAAGTLRGVQGELEKRLGRSLGICCQP